jgi:hypothetical protein
MQIHLYIRYAEADKQKSLLVQGEVAQRVKAYLIETAYQRRPNVVDPSTANPGYALPQIPLVAYNQARGNTCNNENARRARGLWGRQADSCPVPPSPVLITIPPPTATPTCEQPGLRQYRTITGISVPSHAPNLQIDLPFADQIGVWEVDLPSSASVSRSQVLMPL